MTTFDYWTPPIRWSQHKGSHIACHDCVADIHGGIAGGSLKPARHKRTSAATTIWLCSTHAQEWKTAARKAA